MRNVAPGFFAWMWNQKINPGLAILLASGLAASCLAQTGAAERHFAELTEHWRWKQYWTGGTELGPLYVPGRTFEALIFWHKNETQPGVGFCSTELQLCQYLLEGTVYSMKVGADEKLPLAFRRFLDESLGLSSPSLYRASPEHEDNYTRQQLKFILPALDPPQAIRVHAARPTAEIDALSNSIGCQSFDKAGCKVRLLIPFYSPSDPYVPVYRDCPLCANPKPMILFMTLHEGTWWHRATDFTDDANAVDRTRRLIEQALMSEVNR
jgi:hypothetical protein